MWIYGKSCYHGPSLHVRDQHILGSWSSQGSRPALPPVLERSLGSRLRQCLFFPASHHWKQLAELGRTCGWNKARCASCASSERREGLKKAIPGRAWCNDGREFVPVTVSEGPVPVGASAGGRDIVWECIGCTFLLDVCHTYSCLAWEKKQLITKVGSVGNGWLSCRHLKEQTGNGQSNCRCSVIFYIVLPCFYPFALGSREFHIHKYIKGMVGLVICSCTRIICSICTYYTKNIYCIFI